MSSIAPGITWANVMPRQTLANAVETFQRPLPQDGTIEALYFSIDGLGTTTAASDLNTQNKLDVITLSGSGSVDSEVENRDLIPMCQRVWNAPAYTMVTGSTSASIAAVSMLYLNPWAYGGEIEYHMPYGAAPGSLQQVQVTTRANQTNTATLFAEIYAVINTAKQASRGRTTIKRKLRTGVAGAFEFDSITDMRRIMGAFAYLLTGPKDAAGAVPAGSGVRRVALTVGRAERTTNIASTALVTGGLQYEWEAAAPTAANLANYHWLWWDMGLFALTPDPGRPVVSNMELKYEEGTTDAMRRYVIGMK